MILIKQVTILNPTANTEEVADVLVNEGIIQEINTRITDYREEATTIINGEGLILGPGLVDLYSQSGEPGNEARETLSSLTAAAVAGGYTRISILPTVIPPIDNLAVLNSLQEKINRLNISSFPKFNFWGALTTGQKGKTMTEMGDLAGEVVGFSDGYAIDNFQLLKNILEYGQPLKKVIGLVPVDTSLQSNGVMREGIASTRLGLPGNPEVAESSAIASILELVAATETPVHLMRISTARGVELIKEGKQRGLPITASTTWIHLLLDTEAVSTYDPNLRLEPPLGNKCDLEALIEGVKTGVIDAIAVDHTPYTYEEKTLAFGEAPPGVIGLELALALLWQRFIVNGNWSKLQLWKALSTNPCYCLGENPPRCEVGEIAELTLFDPKDTWRVNRGNLKSLANNTPWWGKQVTGRVKPLF